MLGLFGGMGVGLGHLLAGVPGVELMSTAAGLAGLALGPMAGVIVGALAQAVYSLSSPFGLPVPVLLGAQMLGMATAGLLGGLIGPAVRRSRPRAAALLAATAGGLAALVFDLATNLAIAVAFEMPLLAVLAGGGVIALVHIGAVSAAWALLMPGLAGRLARLGRSGPRVPGGVLAVLALVHGPAVAQTTPPDSTAAPATMARPDTTAVAAAAAVDSLATDPADTTGLATDDARATGLPEGVPDGWTRPLWEPFHASFHDHLERETSWLAVRDGGHGSAMLLLGEPGAGVAPTVFRDGLPLGVGHRWLDAPETVPMAGQQLVRSPSSRPLRGDLGEAIVLARHDPWPDRDLLDTSWYAGPHDSFLRDVQFLTADAPWRISFDFAETIDREGYDFRVPGETRFASLDDLFSTEFWGHFRRRSGRGRLERTLTGGDRVVLSLENARKTRRGVPVYDLAQQELWRNEVALRWLSGRPGDPTTLALWWTDSDMLIVPTGSGGERLLEGTRSGARATWQAPEAPWRLDAAYGRWSLHDTGVVGGWATSFADSFTRRGEEASLAATGRTRLAGLATVARVDAHWAEHGGLAVGGRAAVASGEEGAGWEVSLEHARRAPRSDELATPWRVVVPDGRRTLILPSMGLGRERQWRLAASLSRRSLGVDVTLGASLRRLRHGIGWEPDEQDPERGTLVNGVAMESATVRARIATARRLYGWLRLEAEGAWHTWQREDDLRVAMPPRVRFRLGALWEQRFFAEDGIAQLAAYLHNRGAMDDPWFLAEPVALPASTSLDLIAGFRLVGTNLSAELCNVLGAGRQVSANAVATPLELRWRLHWVFHY
ncbi:hypothetical protein GF314_04720 [bacterium]|nr:hypothetical protein [bacterium]